MRVSDNTCRCGRKTNLRGKTCCQMCYQGYSGHSRLCNKRDDYPEALSTVDELATTSLALMAFAYFIVSPRAADTLAAMHKGITNGIVAVMEGVNRDE